jgi:hypothetical protein
MPVALAWRYPLDSRPRREQGYTNRAWPNVWMVLWCFGGRQRVPPSPSRLSHDRARSDAAPSSISRRGSARTVGKYDLVVHFHGEGRCQQENLASPSCSKCSTSRRRSPPPSAPRDARDLPRRLRQPPHPRLRRGDSGRPRPTTPRDGRNGVSVSQGALGEAGRRRAPLKYCRTSRGRDGDARNEQAYPHGLPYERRRPAPVHARRRVGWPVLACTFLRRARGRGPLTLGQPRLDPSWPS